MGVRPARPGWDQFRLLVRESRVRNDGRNVAARTVSRQFFGTVAQPHFASTGAAQRPDLAQEILASRVLEDELSAG